VSHFVQALLSKITDSLNNDHKDNVDEDRFGKRKDRYLTNLYLSFRQRIKGILYQNSIRFGEFRELTSKIVDEVSQFDRGLDVLHDALCDQESKDWLVDLVAYRLLGHQKIKLKTNSKENRETLSLIRRLADKSDFIDVDAKSMQFRLEKFDLSPIGKDIKLYFIPNGVLIDFFIEQYKYSNKDKIIAAQPGDVVIDAGACWGDTALYFSDLVGPGGKVHSFEFIPNNLRIFVRNCELNPTLRENICVVENPIWNESGKPVFYADFGPGSKVAFEDFGGSSGRTETISLDDYVLKKGKATKVDFIKMDIEGAEPAALEGAINIIKMFRPKLAIANYHSASDFVNIPRWIMNLDLGYELFLDHSTIHWEESVVFATCNQSGLQR